MSSHTPSTLESIEPVLLGPVEELFWRAERQLPGAGRVAILCRLDGHIEADPLAAALRHLQRRHPKLRAVIAHGSDGCHRYEFDQVASPIPFDITDYDGGELPWREETRRLLHIDFPASGPLAAVAVLRSRSRGCSTLLLTVHHGIADGLSAIMLVDDLLTEYASAESHLEAPPRPAMPVVAPARATPSGGWLGRLWLLRRYMGVQREERRARQTPLPEAHDIPPQSQWEHWAMSREDTLRLVRRCRREQADLGAALVAAAFCGLMDCLPVPEAVFKCQFPFDLRSALEGPAGPVTPQDLGSFVTVMYEFYNVPRHPVFWDLARRAHENVLAFKQHGGLSFNYNLTTLVTSRLFQRALMPVRNGRVTLLATNYGVLNMSAEYGSLRPRECTLIFNNDTAGPSLIMESLVMGQRLNIGFAADGLEPAFWERLRLAVRRRLDEAGGSIDTA